jgi:hypothetical protein
MARSLPTRSTSARDTFGATSRALSASAWSRRAGNRQGKKKGDLALRDDHDEEPDEDHIVQEGDPFGRPVQIHRMIEAWEEAFDVPPLPGGSGCTDEQDGLLLTAGSVLRLVT